MKILKVVLIAVGTYFVAWTLAYAALMKLDFRFYGEYLRLSWTDPGEFPAFIQWIAALSTFAVLLAYLGRRLFRKHSDH